MGELPAHSLRPPPTNTISEFRRRANISPTMPGIEARRGANSPQPVLRCPHATQWRSVDWTTPSRRRKTIRELSCRGIAARLVPAGAPPDPVVAPVPRGTGRHALHTAGRGSSMATATNRWMRRCILNRIQPAASPRTTRSSPRPTLRLPRPSTGGIHRPVPSTRYVCRRAMTPNVPRAVVPVGPGAAGEVHRFALSDHDEHNSAVPTLLPLHAAANQMPDGEHGTHPSSPATSSR